MLSSNVYYVPGTLLGVHATISPGESYPIKFVFYRRTLRLREGKTFS